MVEIFALFAFLIYGAGLIAGLMVVIAIWRGMKAHEKMAAPMERMANDTERIEETIKRNQTVL